MVDAFPALFNRSIGEQDAQQFSLATVEAVACMNLFIAQQVVECSIHANDVAWYLLTTFRESEVSAHIARFAPGESTQARSHLLVPRPTAFVATTL